jgi:uridine kinase|tara:strand:+ start:4250 stop:4960 length:711 start_codon:yes stop_codon:yes gene_type:complete
MHINKENYKKLLNNNINFITIDGITCSGKTSFAKVLKKELDRYFPNILILSKDLFLYPRKKRINITKKLKNIKSKNQNFLHYDDKKLKTLLNFIVNKSTKKELILKNLYNRKSGKNDYEFKYKYSMKKLIILEGIYVNEDIKHLNKSILRILLINDVYNSLSKKIKRIRDKKISIQLLIAEFINIHLNSYRNYLLNKNYDLFFKYKDNKFSKNKNGKKAQLKDISIFLDKHAVNGK